MLLTNKTFLYMNREEKNKVKKLEEIKNRSLCFLVLGLIIFIIGLLFLPICLVTYKRVTTFDYDSFEAILFYLCVSIGLILTSIGIVFFVKTKVSIKKIGAYNKSALNESRETE